MYSPPSSQKKQAIKQAAIYAVMTLSVVTIVFVLILIVLGYRFNRAEGTIEQGGLVQLNSTPSGANLTVNGNRLGATTSTRMTLSPGEHTIAMSRTGYHTWQKTVTVERGSVLWLNYTRLIPTDLDVENVAQFPAVTSTLPSPNRRWLAMTTDPSSAVITLVDINEDTPQITTLELPPAVYSQSESEAPNESFRLFEWDVSNRYLLLEHRYDDKAEWIVVDIENVAESKNITEIFDVPMTGAKFSHTNGRILYALMGGDLRKIDIGAATISAPLVRGVAQFSLFDRSTIVYTTTLDEKTKSRSVGYIQDGASEPRLVRTYNDDGSVPLHMSIGEYYNQIYMSIAYGNSVEVLKGSLVRSDSDDSLSLKPVATLSTPENIDYLSTRTDGRFVVAQHAKSYSVYDLELEKSTTTTVSGEAPLEGELRWLDDYTVWSSLDSELRLYEFDGANQHDIMPIVPGQNPTLTQNNRYLYAPTKGDDGSFHLSRVRLILP